ncbi:MAG: hypothetical protein LBC11_03725 [Puniceicoccales bacterium]|nr:hypothetical protein [Puniceicoccales bacterium]
MISNVSPERVEGLNVESEVKKIDVKPCSKASIAMGVLIEIVGYPDLGKALQGTPSVLKLVRRCLITPERDRCSQWIYDSSSRRIKLKLLIQAALCLMSVGNLLFKFSGPLAMFHIALKITLCIVAAVQVFMASDKLKSSIANPNGQGNLLLALVFPLFADAIPYFYGMWNVEMVNWYTVTFFSAYTVFLQAFLEKEGFKDVLLATTSIHEFVGPNPFRKMAPKVAQDLWKISHDLASGYCALETLVLFSKRVLTASFHRQGS